MKIYGAGYGREFGLWLDCGQWKCEFCDLRRDGTAVSGNLGEERNGCKETVPGR